VVLVTRPDAAPITYFRNTNFSNSENVFRFSQLLRCAQIEDLLILVPEYASRDFVEGLARRECLFLSGVKRLRINVVNQNIDQMPAPQDLTSLRSLAAELTQTVAHHAYFTQEVADRYGLPTLLLPAYTDLVGYPPAPFTEKEKLIIHSPDDAPYKRDCLAAVQKALPNFELREIRNITFDAFMDLATRCMFSITFGEGFDGYFAHPIKQGGIGFAVFNERFFPSKDLAKRENLFASPNDMIARIGDAMRCLAIDKVRYDALNASWVATIDSLYDLADYRRRISMLARGEFELHPSCSVGDDLCR
jgi:hypothetical protein